MTEAERLQLQDWLRLKPEERQSAIDLARELAKPNRLDALRRLLDDEPKIIGVVKTRDSLALIGAAIAKAAVIITALGVIAKGLGDYFGK